MDGQYLTYEEFSAYGGSMDQGTFDASEFAVRKYLDYLTDRRIKEHIEVIPEEVKRCVYAMIQLESAGGALRQLEKPVTTGFSTDGYSESYGNVLSAEDVKREMSNTAKVYLAGVYDDDGVELMYLGCRG